MKLDTTRHNVTFDAMICDGPPFIIKHTALTPQRTDVLPCWMREKVNEEDVRSHGFREKNNRA